MEYNTQREQLKIADYGRNVVKMIDYAKQLASREDRTRMANTIIDVMAQLNPKIKERTDYRHILWDHLMIMANHEFDVDCPYPINREETENFRPHRLRLHEGGIRYRHYGRALEDMVRAVADMPAGDERDTLTAQIAQNMKRQYLQWNRDTVDDSLITEQLTTLSEGRLQLPAGFQYTDTKEILASINNSQNNKSEGGTKKKKKKKKKNNTAAQQ
ncbi:MAG: DUF4290 domain-containing protein [Bacteroidales bacterium]|nr:DUF4290 domain-containing protein [Bacteroidales bacterium]